MNIKALSETLQSDGVVHVQDLFQGEDLERLRTAIESVAARPSPMARRNEAENGSFFFTDFNNWRRIEDIKAIATAPELLDLVCGLAQSDHCWFFHDHELIKEGAAKATPWHQDRPYYIFKGDKNLSIWIVADDVPRHSSLIFARGSQRDPALYLPLSFTDDKVIEKKDGFSFLDDRNINEDDILDFEMKAGDALVFFHKTLHGSHPHKNDSARRSLSLRYLMDGASLTKAYVNATPPFDRMGVKVVEDGDIPEKLFPKLR